MQISHLWIDRFGGWFDLELTGLSGGLNLFFGPQGVGKSTLAEFVRGALFGYDDRVPYVRDDRQSAGWGGAIGVVGPLGRHTVKRYDDGTIRGQVTIENEQGPHVQERRLHELLARGEQSIFNRVPSAGYGDRLGVDQLLDCAVNDGLDLQPDNGEPWRDREIAEALARRRSELVALPDSVLSLQSLYDRRRHLRYELEVSHDSSWRETRWAPGQRVDVRATTCERELAELQVELRQLDRMLETVDARRMTRVGRGDSRYDRRWWTALDQLDELLAHWREALHDAQEVRERLEDTIDHRGPLDRPGASERLAHARRQLERLDGQLRELHRDLGESDDLPSRQDGTRHFVRSTIRPTLQSMLDDVHSLQRELERRDAIVGREDRSARLDELRRWEIELRQVTRRLMRRRRSLLAGVHGDARYDSALDPALEYPPPLARPDVEHDEEIRRLRRQRDEVVREITDVEWELRQVRDVPLTHAPLSAASRSGACCRTINLDGRCYGVRDELDHVERQIADATKRQQITEEIAALERRLQAAREVARQSIVLHDASGYLDRLTNHAFGRLRLTENRVPWVEQGEGNWREYQQLETAVQDQVYLALYLAIAKAYSRRGICLPLVLDDISAHGRNEWAEATVDVLAEFANQGQQILAFTADPHLASLCRRRSVWVCNLAHYSRHHATFWGHGREYDRRFYHRQQRWEPASRQERTAWRHGAHRVSTPEGLPRDEYPPTAGFHGPSPAQPAGATERFHLRESDAIEAAPSVDATAATELRYAGIHTIGDLLHWDAQQMAIRVRHLRLPVDVVRRWQDEARLVCRVAGLRAYDARVLVTCGIVHPEQLERIHPSELADRIERLAATEIGRALLESGSPGEYERVMGWVDAARGGREPRRTFAQSSPPRERDRSPPDGGVRTRRRRESDDGAPVRRRRRVRRALRSRPVETRGDREHRETKVTFTRTAATADTVRDRDRETTRSVDGSLRHYLDPKSPVVDAPTIGPRMAQRLEAVGIRTVVDLLRADSDEVANQLGQRRIKGDTIRQWQAQAMLACRVPKLRGHDAQILVACGITEPEQLAKLDAQELWSKVGPFVNSNEGRRMIRAGKTPDMAEVTQWVEWARHARMLQAA